MAEHPQDQSASNGVPNGATNGVPSGADPSDELQWPQEVQERLTAIKNRVLNADNIRELLEGQLPDDLEFLSWFLKSVRRHLKAGFTGRLLERQEHAAVFFKLNELAGIQTWMYARVINWATLLHARMRLGYILGEELPDGAEEFIGSMAVMSEMVVLHHALMRDVMVLRRYLHRMESSGASNGV
ncbi:hypothetical protein BDV18DRAFT_158233 [Aspergillus unguis]